MSRNIYKISIKIDFGNIPDCQPQVNASVSRMHISEHKSRVCSCKALFCEGNMDTLSDTAENEDRLDRARVIRINSTGGYRNSGRGGGGGGSDMNN